MLKIDAQCIKTRRRDRVIIKKCIKKERLLNTADQRKISKPPYLLTYIFFFKDGKVWHTPCYISMQKGNC